MKNLEILALPALTRRSLLLPSPFHDVAGFLQTSICGLCSLKELNLRDCYMFDGDIPDNIGSLSSLETLDLSENSTWSWSSEVHSWVSFIPKMFSVNSADRIKVSFRGDDAMLERCGVHLVYKSDMIEI